LFYVSEYDYNSDDEGELEDEEHDEDRDNEEHVEERHVEDVPTAFNVHRVFHLVVIFYPSSVLVAPYGKLSLINRLTSLTFWLIFSL